MLEIVELSNHSTPTERALMVLMHDIRKLKKLERRVRAQIEALAAKHGIEPLED